LFTIILSQNAQGDLDYFKKNERTGISQDISTLLKFDPNKPTLKKKRLRPNPLGDWELRLGIYRVFYNVNEVDKEGTVTYVGWKLNNRLYIRGAEVKI
jgi:mRNA-degrading endonuclease RelE of RelBE toxin-antitoxin system